MWTKMQISYFSSAKNKVITNTYVSKRFKMSIIP